MTTLFLFLPFSSKNSQKKSIRFFQRMSGTVFLLTASCLLLSAAYSSAQGTWTQKANLGGTAKWFAAGFSIGAKGYIGTGLSNPGNTYYKDFWEWDQTSNVWTQKADFGGMARQGSVGFSIGTKGYIGTGSDAGGLKKDFWEWDQAANVWIQKANFGGTAISYAVGFSIGTKGYIGTGMSANKDFWEWNQATNTWTQKANFGGAARDRAVGFSIGATGYIGTGVASSPIYYNDFWAWDQATNVWTQKADFGGTARCEATGFSIGNFGYIGLGTTKWSIGAVSDFWQYDPSANTWTPKANFGGGIRETSPGFSIGCKGYIGTGLINDNKITLKNDFWEYCPDASNTSCTCGVLNVNTASTTPLCNGQCTGTATVTPLGGAGPYTYSWNSSPIQTAQTATGLCAGTYTVIVTDSSSAAATATVIITQPTALTTTVISTGSTCGNNNGSATMTASGGTSGYTYSWNPSGQTTSAATGLGTGNHTATITDANGCTQTQTVTVVSNNVLTINVSSIQTGCTVNNGTATATPLNGTAPYTYIWNNGQTTATAAFLAAGTYTVTVTDINGCTQTQTVTVTTMSAPTVIATASPVIVTAGAGTTLSTSGGGMYNWSPTTGLSCITCSNPMAFPSGTSIYCVTVTDTATGCSDSACVTVLVELDCSNAGELYLPNAFSPNDDGENDKLRIYYGNMACIKTFKLVIYNRWGEKIFESTDPAFTWNGSYGSVPITTGKGKVMNTSVFVYYLKATLISGEEIIRKGNISLIK